MKKTPSKNSQPSKKASMPPLLNGLSKAAGKAFSGHKSDILGLVFLVIGLLSTLGLYFDLAGVVGKILGPWIFLSCFGSVGYAAPVSLIIAGLALSFHSPNDESEMGDDSALPIDEWPADHDPGVRVDGVFRSLFDPWKHDKSLLPDDKGRLRRSFRAESNSGGRT